MAEEERRQEQARKMKGEDKRIRNGKWKKKKRNEGSEEVKGTTLTTAMAAQNDSNDKTILICWKSPPIVSLRLSCCHSHLTTAANSKT